MLNRQDNDEGNLYIFVSILYFTSKRNQEIKGLVISVNSNNKSKDTNCAIGRR